MSDLSGEVEKLRLDLYIAMTGQLVLGGHLADIAELIGLERDCEDLVITPRVRQLVEDPRVQEVLEEFKTHRPRPLCCAACNGVINPPEAEFDLEGGRIGLPYHVDCLVGEKGNADV